MEKWVTFIRLTKKSDTSMSYKCDICDFKAQTTGGLLLHKKVKHSTQSKPQQKPPVSEPRQKPIKKKTAGDVVKDSKSRHKKQLEDYAVLQKKWIKKPTGLANGAKVTKKELVKMFPKGTECPVNCIVSKSITLHSVFETSYEVRVRVMKNDWIRTVLVGKKHNISWLEGPIKNKHKVTLPMIQTK